MEGWNEKSREFWPPADVLLGSKLPRWEQVAVFPSRGDGLVARITSLPIEGLPPWPDPTPPTLGFLPRRAGQLLLEPHRPPVTSGLRPHLDQRHEERQQPWERSSRQRGAGPTQKLATALLEIGVEDHPVWFLSQLFPADPHGWFGSPGSPQKSWMKMK